VEPRRLFSPDINTTWVGIVGPGVRHLGVTGDVWSDQTDLRPTMLSLLGLRDDYRSDGRDLYEFIDESHLPIGLRGHRATVLALGAAYKQLNASVGEFGTNTLVASTKAITSSDPDDARYTSTTAALAALGQARDALAGQIAAYYDEVTFGGSLGDQGRAAALLLAARILLTVSAALAQA
jgi:hypothetical protein